MSLTDRLAKLDENRVRKSTVQVWLDTLSEKDRNLVLEYLRDESISSLSILKALKDEGASFGKDSLLDFRRELRKQNV